MLRSLVQLVFVNVLLSFLYVPYILVCNDILNSPKLIVLIFSIIFFNLTIFVSSKE